MHNLDSIYVLAYCLFWVFFIPDTSDFKVLFIVFALTEQVMLNAVGANTPV